MKVFIAGFDTETNTFAPIPTGKASFEDCFLAHGATFSGAAGASTISISTKLGVAAAACSCLHRQSTRRAMP